MRNIPCGNALYIRISTTMANKLLNHRATTKRKEWQTTEITHIWNARKYADDRINVAES